MTHELKTDPGQFDRMWRGVKTFEIRRDDRNFQIGDTLSLWETDVPGDDKPKGKKKSDLRYTGRFVTAAVIGIMRGPVYGLADGWVIMSVVCLDRDEAVRKE